MSNQVMQSDLKDVDDHNNLLTVTATAHAGQARITGQVNGKTVRDEVLFSVNDQERLDASAQSVLELLKRSARPVQMGTV